MSKHTPGLLSVDDSYDGRGQSLAIIEGDGVSPVAMVYDQRKDLANLFAESPRLLECLRELAKRCAAIPANQKSVGFQEEISCAFDAIAKAEGKGGRMSQYQEFKALCAEYLALQAKVKEFVTKHERGNVTTRAGHCLLDFMTSTEVRFDGYKDTFDERWQEWRAEQEAKKAAGGE